MFFFFSFQLINDVKNKAKRRIRSNIFLIQFEIWNSATIKLYLLKKIFYYFTITKKSMEKSALNSIYMRCSLNSIYILYISVNPIIISISCKIIKLASSLFLFSRRREKRNHIYRKIIPPIHRKYKLILLNSFFSFIYFIYLYIYIYIASKIFSLFIMSILDSCY